MFGSLFDERGQRKPAIQRPLRLVCLIDAGPQLPCANSEATHRPAIPECGSAFVARLRARRPIAETTAAGVARIRARRDMRPAGRSPSVQDRREVPVCGSDKQQPRKNVALPVARRTTVASCGQPLLPGVIRAVALLPVPVELTSSVPYAAELRQRLSRRAVSPQAETHR